MGEMFLTAIIFLFSIFMLPTVVVEMIIIAWVLWIVTRRKPDCAKKQDHQP